MNKFKETVHCVKSVRIRSYSSLHFPSFELNTGRYSVSLRIQSKCGKMRTRITPNTDTFHAVIWTDVPSITFFCHFSRKKNTRILCLRKLRKGKKLRDFTREKGKNAYWVLVLINVSVNPLTELGISACDIHFINRGHAHMKSTLRGSRS